MAGLKVIFVKSMINMKQSATHLADIIMVCWTLGGK